MQVAALDDGRIDENMLALSIGLASTGVYGLARAVNSEQWYRNIILHDSMYSCDKLLEYVYPELAKQNSWNFQYGIILQIQTIKVAWPKAKHRIHTMISFQKIPSSEIGLLSQVALQWKYGHKKKQTSSKR